MLILPSEKTPRVKITNFEMTYFMDGPLQVQEILFPIKENRGIRDLSLFSIKGIHTYRVPMYILGLQLNLWSFMLQFNKTSTLDSRINVAP